MAQVPYPGFPPYPPGHPGNASWEAKMVALNAETEARNKAFIVKTKLVFLTAILWTILLHLLLY